MPILLTLAIETSTRRASVALQVGPLDRAGVSSSSTSIDARSCCFQAEVSGDAARVGDLLPLAHALFEEAGADPRDLTHVLVGTGPGSYTGLRIGVSLALGLAVGPAPPLLLGVPTCDAILADRLGTNQPSATWLGDARAGTWYQSAASFSANHFEVTSPASIIPESALESALVNVPLVVTDEASLAALVARFPQHNFEAGQPTAKQILNLGQTLLAQGATPTAPGQLAPLYLREFAAKIRTR